MEKKQDMDPELQYKLEAMFNDDNELEVVSAESIARLKKVGNEFLKPGNFAPGDLVEWKPGCKNKRMPPEGIPAIVVEVIDPPIRDTEEQNAGSAYFREPLDLACGWIDSDGDFMVFHFDSRRFRLYEEK